LFDLDFSLLNQCSWLVVNQPWQYAARNYIGVLFVNYVHL